MQWFLNLTTRTKLLLGFGLMVLFLLGVSAASYAVSVELRNSLESLYEEQFAMAVDLKAVRANQNAIRADLMTMLLVTTPSEWEPWQQDIAERDEENDALMQGLLARAQGDPGLRSRLDEFDGIRTAYRQTRETEIMPLILAGKVDETRTVVLGVQADRDEQLRALADQLVSEAQGRAENALEQAQQRATTYVSVLGIVGLLALTAGAAMALMLDRAIADPLRAIAGVAERVASGDLTVQVPANRRADEVGVLTQTFRRMVEALREMNQEIHTGVNVLGSSTSQILAATPSLPPALPKQPLP